MTKNNASTKVLIICSFILILNIFFTNIVSAQSTPPVSTNYKLEDFAWGSGGTEDSDSAAYSIFGISGELSENAMNSTNYKTWPGLVYTMMANVPLTPALTNPNYYYNRLKITLATANNPADAEYAIAISSDNFATTNYLKTDGTLTPTLTNAEFQTYAQWGGASGTDITGLNPSTTYYAKVKARQGNFTESPFSPVSSVATSTLMVSFDIDVHASDTETSPPYQLALNELAANSVITGAQSVWLDLSTNAVNGAVIYVMGQEGGLTSNRNTYTIASTTADLTGQTEGVGLQATTVTQASGGPLAKVSPYNGAGNSVGEIPVQLESIFFTPSAITSGRGAFVVKAKSGDMTPAANDYRETLTVVVAPSF